MFVLTPNDDFSNVPQEKIWDELNDEVLFFMRLIRPHIKKGKKLSELDHPLLEEFQAAMDKLKFALEIELPDEEFLKYLYDTSCIQIDRKGTVNFFVVLHPATLTNMILPANLKKKHQLVPMSVYEPNHYYNYHKEVYGEMQLSIISRNREASEMNHRVQHGTALKGERQRHKDEKEAIRKEARRWDCMKWHMKLIHWQSVEACASYCDILNDEAFQRMTPAEMIVEVQANWYDEYGIWEKEAILICSEADGWNHLQLEMERNKFNAKFRMKAGTGAASSRQSQGGNFKSAGGMSSKVGPDSMASQTNFRSAGGTASMNSVASSASSVQKSTVDSGSSVEHGSTVEADDDAEEGAAKGQSTNGTTSGMSSREAKSFREKEAKDIRIKAIAAETGTFTAPVRSILSSVGVAKLDQFDKDDEAQH